MNDAWHWLLNGPLGIERMLALEVLALGLLLAVLRIRRAVLTYLRRPAASAMPQPVTAPHPAQSIVALDPPRGPAATSTGSSLNVPASVPLAASIADAAWVPAGVPPHIEPRAAGFAAARTAVSHAAEAGQPMPRPAPIRVGLRRDIDDTVLSPETLLARANDYLADGATEEAAVQFRLCVRLAAKLKQPAIEAVARLELGDLARAAGDLTTACEHWQLARSLFADQHRPAESLAAEQRMERAGCPTDWVLTQF